VAVTADYEYDAIVTSVVDGDTIDADVDLGFRMHAKLRFRLLGINAPETYGVSKESAEYQAGLRAKEWLRERVEGRKVLLVTHKDSTEKYGRWLAIVMLDGQNLNEQLLSEGLAKPY
jgi:micrococcal nuclease